MSLPVTVSFLIQMKVFLLKVSLQMTCLFQQTLQMFQRLALLVPCLRHVFSFAFNFANFAILFQSKILAVPNHSLL